MPVPCKLCGSAAMLKRPKTSDALCKECFFQAFEVEVHNTITDNQLFTRGDFVAIAASGGKDSTVLAYIMKLLNERHDYGIRLVLLSIDEGITGYRDDSLQAHKSFLKLQEADLATSNSKRLVLLALFMCRTTGPGIGISGMGFFTITTKFATWVLSSFYTYFFLLIQFSPPRDFCDKVNG